MAKPLLTAAAKPTARWLRRELRPDTSVAALDAAADQLAADVARIERIRLDQLQVSYESGVPVRFGDLARVEFPAVVSSLGTLDSVAPFYEELTRPRRLLVVGEPGSGKTVLVLHLILDLLSKRRASSDVVPVRCNATGWDGRLDLTEFLVAKLSGDYALHKRVARALVDNGRILPVIDGLDEMDVSEGEPHRAQAAVQRFNEPPWRARALVVTCRTAVYEAIRSAGDGTEIIGCEPVSVRPLTAAEIAEWVETLLDKPGHISPKYARRLTPMLEELDSNPDGTLATTLRTPWMLTLALSYLEGADPAAAATLVTARSGEAITDLLFAAQIPTACAQQRGEPATWTYSVPDVQRWMRNLAQHLSVAAANSRQTEIPLHQVWLLAGQHRTRRLHQFLAGMAGGLAIGLAVGPAVGLAVGLVVGLAVGFGIGLVAGEKMPRPQRIVLSTRRKGALRARLALSLPFGLALGLIMVAMFSLPRGVLAQSALVGGLTLGLTCGLMLALIFVPARFHVPQDPGKEIRDDRIAGLALALTFGATAPAIFVLTFRPTELKQWVLFGLAAGLVMGLLIAAAAGRYGCAVLIFRRTGTFAPRPARFLEWATRTGLLRITGSAYQLRHDTYRQWLTDHPASEVADQGLRAT